MTIGSLVPAAICSISHIRARPCEDVAVATLPPAAAAPMHALIALCSLSTSTSSVSTFPSFTKLENLCMRSVAGVIGYAAHTSGLICLRASAHASFPVTATILPIICPPLPLLLLCCPFYRGTRGHRFRSPCSNQNQNPLFLLFPRLCHLFQLLL